MSGNTLDPLPLRYSRGYKGDQEFLATGPAHTDYNERVRSTFKVNPAQENI